jgi:hypothetical protein
LARTTLSAFVTQHAAGFQNAINARQRAFGDETQGRIYDATNTVIAASFVGEVDSASPQQNQFGHPQHNRFTTPPGLDLAPLARRGDAFLLAWAPGYSPVKPIHQFNPRRSHRDTLFRLAVEVKKL